MIDTELRWAAFEAPDRSRDGEFIGAVRTTGIYCKPSCPARHSKRDHVEFFTTPAEARAAGYRACLRCRPDEVGRDREAVAEAVRMIKAAEEPLQLGQLARAVGYAPHHFQRLFTRDLGVSPAAFARALRAHRAETHLDAGKPVTDAIYDSGFAAPSRFYADASDRLGMTPSAWRDGGRGETIRFVVAQSPLGSLLVAATPKGICRLTFDEDEGALTRRFPNADIQPDDGTISAWVQAAIAAVGRPGATTDCRSMSAERLSRKRCGVSCAASPLGRRAAMPQSPPRSGSPARRARWGPRTVPIRSRCWSRATA